MTILAVAAVVFAGAYWALSPTVAEPLYNQMLFYPDYPVRFSQEQYDAVRQLRDVPKQDVRIPSTNNTTLHAWFFRKPGAKYVVMLSHGNASNIANRVALIDDLLQLGCSVLAYDYQGYGLSEGSPSIKNICSDGAAAFDYLVRDQGY
jgi:hypothetical protein